MQKYNVYRWAVVLLLMFSSFVQAHVGLKNTVPSKEAMLMSSPEKLSLSYSGEVRVVKVKLKDTEGNNIDFGFKPSTEAAKTFDWSLPTLPPASYEVNWIVMGKDGHKMTGSFGFIVH